MLRLFVLWLRNWKLRTAADAAVAPLTAAASRASLAAAPRQTVIEEMESRTMLAGNGLAVTYFDNDNLTGKTVSRVDATVNFDWVGNSPASGIGVDTFSARWTGSVVPTKTETYTFYTVSDDGVRLWVDGKQLVNNWTEHAPREDKGTITLQAGKAYDLKLEYNEKYYGAVMKLLWSSPSTAKQVIPQSQLYSTAPAATPVTPPASSGPTPVGSGNGLAAAYFDNDNFTGKTVNRTDAKVDFDWRGGSPASGIAGDTFSVRWTGQVLAQKTEEYTFYTQSDDGVRLWVNGQQVINNWTAHASTENSGRIRLEAGKKYDVKLEYYNRAGGSVAQLKWSSPSTAKQVVPQAQLFSAAAVTPPDSSGPVPAPLPGTDTGAPTGNGNGLAVTYYDNNNFTGGTVTRTDAKVDFNWGGGSPASAIAPDTFSARWTGQVLAQKTEEYTFYTNSDDGVRLWVNGQLLINNWTTHAPIENSGRIRLEAGKKYDIKLEYYEQSAGAVIQLKWSSPSTAKQVIPQSQLFSAAPVTPPSGSTPTPVPPPPSTGTTNVRGLLATFFNNSDFTGNQVSRYDANVAYDWGTSSPHEVIGRDTWAARWEGQVVANKGEEHTFYITSDGGARLWVDGKLVINDWGDHAKREASGKIYLAAGRHDIKMEYLLTTGSAVMQFRWSTPTIAKNFVPNSNLYAAAPPTLNVAVPPVSAFTGYKTYTNDQVNFRPGSATDKTLTVDGYRISKIPIDHKGLNIAVTDLVPGQKAFAYRNITIKNTEISDVYRTPGYHNDFIRIAGAAGRQDALMNVTLENIKIHDGQAIPILITDGDYDTIVIRNVSITNCTVAQLQINTQNVGSIKRIIVENCPGLSVAITGRPGTVGEVFVRNSPGSRVADSLMSNGTRTGARMTILP